MEKKKQKQVRKDVVVRPEVITIFGKVSKGGEK